MELLNTEFFSIHRKHKREMIHRTKKIGGPKKGRYINFFN